MTKNKTVLKTEQKQQDENVIPVENRPHFISTSAEMVSYLARFMSREETRYYLNGICFERHSKKGILMISTDGHRMGVMYDEKGVLEGPDRVVVPIGNIIKNAGQKRSSIPLGFYRHGNTSMVLCGQHCHTREDVLRGMKARIVEGIEIKDSIDGTFPNWREVITAPDKLGPTKKLGYNAQYLHDFGVGGHSDLSVTIFTPKDTGDPSVVKVAYFPNFTGFLMPLRTSVHSAYDGIMEEELRLREVRRAEAKAAEKLAKQAQRKAESEARKAEKKAKKLKEKKPTGKK